MPLRQTALFAACFAFASTLPAQTLVSTPFAGTLATNFENACDGVGAICFGTGPVMVGDNGYTVTLTANAPAAYGQLNTGFVDNGTWTTRRGVSASLFHTHVVSLAFASPVTHIGAYMNYVRGFQSDAPLLRIYDALDVFRGEFDLAALAPITFAPGDLNAAAFRGVTYAGGIGRLELTGANLSLTDLLVRTDVPEVTVPEPSALALLAAGSLLLAVAAARRRRLLTR